MFGPVAKLGSFAPKFLSLQVLLDAPCSGESLTRKEGLEMLDHPPGYVEGLRGPQPRQNFEGDPFGMGVVQQKSS